MLPRMTLSKTKKIRETNNENAVNRHTNGQAGSRFGANYQAPDRKLNAGDILIAFVLGLSFAAMLIL